MEPDLHENEPELREDEREAIRDLYRLELNPSMPNVELDLLVDRLIEARREIKTLRRTGWDSDKAHLISDITCISISNGFGLVDIEAVLSKALRKLKDTR